MNRSSAKTNACPRKSDQHILIRGSNRPMRLSIRFASAIAAMFIGLPEAPAADEIVPVDRMAVSGCVSYAEREILEALCTNEPSVKAFAQTASPDIICDIIQKQIQLGYQTRGFRDAQVDVKYDAKSSRWNIVIVEGATFIKGNVVVTGLPAAEAEDLKLIIATETKDHAGEPEIDASIKRWKKRASLSFNDHLDANTESLVKESLSVLGYPEAVFRFRMVEQQTSSSGAESKAVSSVPLDLYVDVQNSGTPLTCGDIHITGLTRHSPQQIQDFLKLKPGVALTKTTRRQIVQKLTDSGRFLKVELRSEPFLFDPADPLDVHIRVREFTGIAPLGEEVTGPSATLLKFAQSISQWNTSNQDYVVTVSAPMEDAREFVSAMLPGSDQFTVGVNREGTCRIQALISPNDGTAFELTLTGREGEAISRRTILAGSGQVGVIESSRNEKWLLNQLSTGMHFSVGLDGIWENPEERETNLTFGWGMSTEYDPGLQVSVTCNPAVILNGQISEDQMVSQDGDVLRISSEEDIDGRLEKRILELDAATGALRSFSVSGDQTTLSIKTEEGLVKSLIKERLQEAEPWTNLAESDLPWSSLIRMFINTDHETVRNATEMKLVRLMTSLLENPRAMKSLNDGVTSYLDDDSFAIPRATPADRIPQSPWMGFAMAAVAFTPRGLFIHDAGRAASASWSLNDPRKISTILNGVLEDRSNGALNCLQGAILFSKSDQAPYLFLAARDRMSTEQFQHDIAPLIENPSVIRESLLGLMFWLQELSDDDAETLSSFMAENLKDLNVSHDQIQMLFQLVRMQKDRPPEECLKDTLTLCWNGFIKAALTDFIDSKSTKNSNDTGSAFRSASMSSDDKTSDGTSPISIETNVPLSSEINNLLNADDAAPFGLKPFNP